MKKRITVLENPGSTGLSLMVISFENSPQNSKHKAIAEALTFYNILRKSLDSV